MAQQKTKKQWEYWFKKFENGKMDWNEYFKTIAFTDKFSARYRYISYDAYKQKQAMWRFIYKYKSWKNNHNIFMKKKEQIKKLKK